jgi:hypothetical protein
MAATRGATFDGIPRSRVARRRVIAAHNRLDVNGRNERALQLRILQFEVLALRSLEQCALFVQLLVAAACGNLAFAERVVKYRLLDVVEPARGPDRTSIAGSGHASEQATCRGLLPACQSTEIS